MIPLAQPTKHTLNPRHLRLNLPRKSATPFSNRFLVFSNLQRDHQADEIEAMQLSKKSLAILAIALFSPLRIRSSYTPETWTLESANSIGDHSVKTIGSPEPADTTLGNALKFSGDGDGILISSNPLANKDQFTIQALIKVDPDGQFQQRFLHLGTGYQERALLELRLREKGLWYLDGFLLVNGEELTLADNSKLHPANAWTWTALTYDGENLSTYVNSILQAQGEISSGQLPDGRTSIGMRMTETSWFKGMIREVRFHERALEEAELEKVVQPDASR